MGAELGMVRGLSDDSLQSYVKLSIKANDIIVTVVGKYKLE
jgi:hypothetical protein